MSGGRALPPDGGWQAWSQVFAYFMISFCCLGVIYAHGLLYAEWLDMFGESRSLTASVTVLATAVMEGSGYLSGTLITRFDERRCCFGGGLIAAAGLLFSSFATSIWHLHLSFSLLVGFGHSLSLFSGVVVVNRWFSTKQALVSGIGNTGSGAGTLCFGFFVPPLIDSGNAGDDIVSDAAVSVADEHSNRNEGWRVALRVLAIITAALLCAASLLLHHPASSVSHASVSHDETECDQPSDSGDTGTPRAATNASTAQPTDPDLSGTMSVETQGAVVPLRELLRVRALQPVLAYTFVYAFALWVPPTFVVKVADDSGWTEEDADGLVWMIGLGSMCSRIPSMMLAHKLGCRFVVCLALVLYSAACTAAAFVIQSEEEDFADAVTSASSGEEPPNSDGTRFTLQTLAVVAGGCVGVLMSGTSPLAAAAVTERQMPQAVTLAYSSLLVGILSGAPLAGLLCDATGSMVPAFFASGLIFAVAALVLNVDMFQAKADAAPPEPETSAGMKQP